MPNPESTDPSPETLYPLSSARPGVAVRIKQLSGAPEVAIRLREMGFCEEQCIRLISRQNHYLCQVCHARIGISSKLADHIWVEPATGTPNSDPARLPARKVA